MKKAVILVIALLMLAGIGFGCDKADEIKDKVEEKVDEIASTPTPTDEPTSIPIVETTITPPSLAECVKVTEVIDGANRPAGAFFTNTVTLNVPEQWNSIVMTQDCEGTKPIGIDDEAKVTVTSPSGHEQVATISENGAFGDPIGEQWILSNVINFEPGLNEIKVELINVYAPSGSNSASSSIYIVVLSSTAITLNPITMDIDAWTKVNTGEWEKTVEGIKVYGAGYRLGHQGLLSKEHFNFVDSETFIKWKSNGGSGQYSSPWIFLMSDYDIETSGYSGAASAGYFTTHHSWKNSVVMNEDIWYFTEFKVNADSTYTAVTSTGDYDSNGGTVFHTNSGTFDKAQDGAILAGFNDNYGGTEAYIVVGEVKTTAGPAVGTTADSSEQQGQDDTDNSDKKVVLIWPRDGVRNATMNGIPLEIGEDNSVEISYVAGQTCTAYFEYTDEWGREQETTLELDSYYDYFILKENGGWGSLKYQDAYESEKISG